MAFSSKSKYGLDNSDMRSWASHDCRKVFSEELLMLQKQALQRLLKDGEKNHSKNAESYKAFEKVIKLFDEAENL